MVVGDLEWLLYWEQWGHYVRNRLYFFFFILEGLCFQRGCFCQRVLEQRLLEGTTTINRPYFWHPRGALRKHFERDHRRQQHPRGDAMADNTGKSVFLRSAETRTFSQNLKYIQITSKTSGNIELSLNRILRSIWWCSSWTIRLEQKNYPRAPTFCHSRTSSGQFRSKPHTDATGGHWLGTGLIAEAYSRRPRTIDSYPDLFTWAASKVPQFICKKKSKTH